jgi:hypothetical protein
VPVYAVEVEGVEKAINAASTIDAAFIAAAQKINAVTKDVSTSEAGFQRYFERIESVKGELVATGAAGTGAMSRISTTTTQLATMFQSVSRDVDTIAGKSAAGFGRMANDALGFASALTGGPLTAGIAAVTAAVGGIAAAFSYVQEQAKENAARVESYHAMLIESSGKWRRSVDDVTASYIRAGYTAGIQEVNARIAALDLALREQKEIYDANAFSTDIARKVQADSAANAMRVVGDEIEQLKEKRDILNDDMEQQLQVIDAEAVAREQEDARKRRHAAADAERLRQKADRERAWADEAKRLQKQEEDSDKRFLDGKRKQAQDELAIIEDTNRAAFDAELQRQRLVGDAIDAAAKHRINRIQSEVVGNERATEAQKIAALQAIADIEAASIRSAHAIARAEIDAKRMAGDISDGKSEAELMLDRIRLTEELTAVERRRADAVRDLSLELRAKADADDKAAKSALADAIATEVYGAAVMTVQPIVQSFTSQIARLGELNRDNFEELLAHADELPAIIAKEAQGIAARVASEAAGKAALSTFDAGRETALGVGQLAYGNVPSATAHFKSAGIHLATAAGYATLAGGAGGVAVGIGLSRGEGGLFELTRDERAAREGTRGGVGMGGGSTSSDTRITTARGGAASEGVTLNVLVGPGGLYAPGDDRRTRAVVAEAFRRNRKDAFEMMRDREVG